MRVWRGTAKPLVVTKILFYVLPRAAGSSTPLRSRAGSWLQPDLKVSKARRCRDRVDLRKDPYVKVWASARPSLHFGLRLEHHMVEVTGCVSFRSSEIVHADLPQAARKRQCQQIHPRRPCRRCTLGETPDIAMTRHQSSALSVAALASLARSPSRL